MKKRHLLLALFTCVAMISKAEAPKLEWAALGDGVEMEIPQTTKPSADGDVYILASFSSSAKADTGTEKHGITTDYIYYDITSGSPTVMATSTGLADASSTSGNPNMVLYKVGADGQLKWRVNSNKGYYYNNGSIAPTSDGGVILALKMRHAQSTSYSYNPDVLLGINDANGKQTDVMWDAPDYATYGGVYQPVLVKVSKDGAIEWTKHYPVGYKVEGTTKFSDNYDITDLVTDPEDNIYLCGSYATSINFGEKANLTNPHNVEGRTSSESRGDMFVVKLNQQGEAVWNVVTTGVVQYERPYSLAIEGNNLYFLGTIVGNDDLSQTAYLGNSALTPNGGDCLFYGSINTGGEVRWAHVLKVERNENETRRGKPTGISVNEEKNSLLLCGSFLGNMTSSDNQGILSNPNSNTGGLRAYLLQCNPTTGAINNTYAWLDASYISETLNAYRIGDKVYACSYISGASSYFMEFDAQLNKIEENALVTCGGQFSAQGGFIMGNKLISLARARTQTYGSIVFEGTNLTLKTNNGGWASIFTGHTLPGMPSNMEDITNSDLANAVVYSSGNTLFIHCNQPETITIYNLSGQLIELVQAQAGETSLTLPQGIYIVNKQKVVIL